MTEIKNKNNIIQIKRLPKGQRKHIRIMKQEARRDGTVYLPPKKHQVPVKPAGD